MTSTTNWDVQHGRVGGVAMLGFRDRSSCGLDLHVVGMPAVTLVFGFGDDLTVDGAAGQQTVTGFASGISAGAMRVRSPRAECVEVRLSPLQAYSLLDSAPADLGPAAVGVDDLWGRRATQLSAQLAEASKWTDRFAATRSLLASAADPRRTPDPEVVSSWQQLVSSRGQVPIGALAESCGWSRKRLWRRFEAQVGLTPKRAAMLIRFRFAVEGLLAGHAAADVAAAYGYTDQSHLCRDVSSFAQATPGAVADLNLSVIAELRRQTWGTFLQYVEGPVG
ncbi:helix-turn-helix domain-containing protein [Mycobacterium sp. DL440]|uniref:helix-turn-helix domain-containing protein n=1 Tax=Mycobacterium sp. DL440 TaxID=2675523 RepID=UPI001FB98D80|nr:helix-turn-helix domain-containing protein [Mycobacterium sp. DL440]